jgi:hypothetical protein
VAEDHDERRAKMLIAACHTPGLPADARPQRRDLRPSAVHYAASAALSFSPEAEALVFRGMAQLLCYRMTEVDAWRASISSSRPDPGADASLDWVTVPQSVRMSTTFGAKNCLGDAGTPEPFE